MIGLFSFVVSNVLLAGGGEDSGVGGKHIHSNERIAEVKPIGDWGAVLAAKSGIDGGGWLKMTVSSVNDSDKAHLLLARVKVLGAVIVY